MDIVEILKIGFSGFAFLLAWFAYKLLSEEQKNDSPRESQLNAIYTFMAFSLILGILTLFAPFIPKMLEEKPDPYMEAMLESAKNRKPMPLDFVEAQIGQLTAAHTKRVETLHLQRDEQEKLLHSSLNVSSDVRRIESSIRRIEQYIRQENMAYDSKVRDFRSML